MNNYVTVVFKNDEDAYEGLHALWRLDDAGDITVHGAAVVHRDRQGHLDVAMKRSDVGLRTLAGAGVGALIGAIAGPVGTAMGIAGASTIAAGSAAAAGAAAGSAAGLTAEGGKAIERDEAGWESRIDMQPGQAAVLTEVSEEWTTPLDTEMRALGGVVYRRDVKDVRKTAFFGDEYTDYLYPYDYQPEFYT